MYVLTILALLFLSACPYLSRIKSSKQKHAEGVRYILRERGTATAKIANIDLTLQNGYTLEGDDVPFWRNPITEQDRIELGVARAKAVERLEELAKYKNVS